MRLNTHTAAWVRKLNSVGITYGISVLEDVGCQDGLDDAERKWISHYRARGSDLTNCTDGGEGTPGWMPPADFCEVVRKRTEQAWKDGVYGNDAYLEKHRLRKTAEWANPEQRAKLLASLNRPEVRKARLAAIMDPENQRKAHEAMRRPENRARLSDSMHRYFSDPKNRDKLRKKRTPEQRARIKAGRLAYFARLRAPIARVRVNLLPVEATSGA